MTTALYIRLSKEDDNIGDSDSVKNQRDLLNDFVNSSTDIPKDKILEFVDDGYSGTNFNRPAVKNMLDMARKGLIQCVIVKDFSRFGRNYIEVCDYLEQIFPFLDLRFISVNDQYDSLKSKGRTIGLETAFKTLIHDLYCKELSLKVIQGYQAKAKKGEYLCTIAPFGYKRSETVKNKLEIDEPAAKIIRQIFELAHSGMKMTDIARKLNCSNVDTPLMYRRKNGTDKCRGWNIRNDVNYWTYSAVGRILRDERFTGKLVAGKRTQSKLREVRSQDQPKDQWIFVENTHDAIISEEIFFEVQAMLPPYKSKTAKYSTKAHLYSRKVICGHCNHSLSYANTRGVNQHFVCITFRSTNSEKCFTDYITEDMISNKVLLAVKDHCINNKEFENVKNAEEMLKQAEQNYKAQIKEYEAKLQRIKYQKVTLFEEYSFGNIQQDEFLKAKENCNSKIDILENELKNLKEYPIEQIPSSKNIEDNNLQSFVNAKKVTSELVELIDKITVYDSKHIDVKFMFGD